MTILKAIKEVFLGGNISEVEFEEAKQNANNIPDNDVMWGLLNRKLHSYMKESNWQGMKLIYFDMATFLRIEGRDFFHILQQVHKCELMSYKKAEFERVEILTAREASCGACSKLEGKILTIDGALETMPIPVKDCKTSVEGNNGWCRCLYSPIR